MLIIKNNAEKIWRQLVSKTKLMYVLYGITHSKSLRFLTRFTKIDIEICHFFQGDSILVPYAKLQSLHICFLNQVFGLHIAICRNFAKHKLEHLRVVRSPANHSSVFSRMFLRGTFLWCRGLVLSIQRTWHCYIIKYFEQYHMLGSL